MDGVDTGSMPAHNEEDAMEEELREHFPTSFGAQPKKPSSATAKPITSQTISYTSDIDTHRHEDPEDAEIGPPRPPTTACGEDADDVGPHLAAADRPADPWRLPISSEAVLEQHSRAVVALALDHSGSRLVSGSDDYTVKLFDFNGMKSDCRPFRSMEPSDGHPVVSLSWSPTGDAFFVVTGSPQPKVYDRDGKEQGELPRGDMYIRDMKNTKGHVSGCTGGAWHPVDKGTGVTSSSDGTLRVWDLWTLEQKTVIKPTLARPGRVSVTTCAWNGDGRVVAGGLMDGTLQLWDVRGKFGLSAAVGVVAAPKAQAVAKQQWTYVSRTGQLVREAHAPCTEVTCLKFSQLDGHALLSRGADETLKIWDIRQFKHPMAVAEGLPTLFGNTQCCFSPDEKLVLTGIGPREKDGCGALAVFDRTDLSLVRSLGVNGSCVAVLWHPKINQIVLGCGTRKEGTARVLYDSNLSTRGALLALGRRPRAENMADYTAEITPQIYNPNALPLYRDAVPAGLPGSKRKKAPVDMSIRTSKSFRPDAGQAGTSKGAGGKLGATGGTLLTQYILKHQGALKAPADEDVRASILRHAGKEDEFSRFTAAYAATQPQRIYAEEEKEEEGEEGQPPPT